jgi:hypothetical protein
MRRGLVSWHAAPVRAAVLATLATGCFTIHVAKPADQRATKATPFALAAQDGSTVTLAEVLAQEHAVLVFYRGHW